MPVPIRFGESNYDLQDFKVRFVELKDLEKQEEGKITTYLANQVEDVATETYSDYKLRDKADINGFLKSMSSCFFFYVVDH